MFTLLLHVLSVVRMQLQQLALSAEDAAVVCPNVGWYGMLQM